jgi:aryl-alcohol dehydrogenase-like predicted oxidoreductase
VADFHQRVTLGKSGLSVSRLGLGASYGAPSASYEEAFERGVNYFYWGSRRRASMRDAIRQIAASKRDDLVVVVQTYARLGSLVGPSVEWALRQLRIDHADVVLLGWFNDTPPARIADAAVALVEQCRARAVALSSHRRTLFPELIADPRFAIWHLRYNAVHRGAEREVFPALADVPRQARPGIVSYTTTRWGHLCDPRRTPLGERTPTGTDCYRFALTHPDVDLAIAGPADAAQMQHALAALDAGPLSAEEVAWMCRVGDHIYGRDATSGVRD